MSTLAAIMVPISAPICMKAPRALNTRVKAKASVTMKTKPTAASTVSLRPSGDRHSPS